MAKATQKLGELVDLKALILNTATQIREAREQAKEEATEAGHDAVMEFSGCEIELAVKATFEAGVGVKFWVLDLSTKGSAEGASKIKLTFGAIAGHGAQFYGASTDDKGKPAPPRG
jgi:hypothetical protein